MGVVPARIDEAAAGRGLGVTGAQQGVVEVAAGDASPRLPVGEIAGGCQGGFRGGGAVGVVRCGAEGAELVGQPDLSAASEAVGGGPGDLREGIVAANQKPRQTVTGEA